MLALERGGVRVSEITVTAHRRRVILHGAVPSHLVREHILELALSVDGVKTVDDRLTVAAAVDPAAEAVGDRSRHEVYIAQPGDTLPIIAERLFGDRARWRDLLALNAQCISDPEVLQPGLRVHVRRR